MDARGTVDKRFYFVKWKRWDVSEGSWLHSRELQGAQKCVDDFWALLGMPFSSVLNPQGEIRCEDCNKRFKRDQDLKRHSTVGCPWREASRVGSKAETAVLKSKQIDVQEAAGVVMMETKRLENVFNFDYLGFRFQADGDRGCALEQRMAIARTRFGQLHEIWRSKKLPTSAKLRIYACAVVSVLTYGNEIWKFTEKIKAKIRGWNARCLTVITGRDFREETVEPSFDLVARLRSRRLRWAGHILRLEESSLLRKVLLAQAQVEGSGSGGLLDDAPAFGSTEDLLELAQDRDGWREMVQALLPAGDPKSRKGGNKTKQNKI